MLNDLRTLTLRQLRARQAYLDQCEKRIEIYEQLARCTEGQLLLQELKSELEFVRDKYTEIDASHANAQIELAGIQTAEAQVKSWVLRISDHKAYRDELIAERDRLREIAKERSRRGQGGDFLPPGLPRTATKERDDDSRME
jgi:hypothetical protein